MTQQNSLQRTYAGIGALGSVVHAERCCWSFPASRNEQLAPIQNQYTWYLPQKVIFTKALKRTEIQTKGAVVGVLSSPQIRGTKQIFFTMEYMVQPSTTTL